MTPVAMTIAGSDPSGGAGLQADLKTFHQHGVYGTSVVTLLTVQNTLGVSAVEVLSSEFVLAQFDAVESDIPPAAAKTGALGDAAIVAAVAERTKTCSFPLVVDPVMVSKHGAPLMDEDAVEVLLKKLLPNAFLVTPNLPEAARLSGMDVTDRPAMEEAAGAIARLGVKNVLVKGGHLKGDAVDLLWRDGEVHWLEAGRVDTRHTHGAGCVLSAAITARLAKGEDLTGAVEGAKRFVTTGLQNAPGLGRGWGPLGLHGGVGQVAGRL